MLHLKFSYLNLLRITTHIYKTLLLKQFNLVLDAGINYEKLD